MSPLRQILKTYRATSQAGRDLAHWHLNYETVERFPGVAVKEEGSYCPSLPAEEPHPHSQEDGTIRSRLLKAATFRVTKMKFGKTNDANGKPALEWVMERQSVTTDKDSGAALMHQMRQSCGFSHEKSASGRIQLGRGAKFVHGPPRHALFRHLHRSHHSVS